jgi:hypothetical protein
MRLQPCRPERVELRAPTATWTTRSKSSNSRSQEGCGVCEEDAAGARRLAWERYEYQYYAAGRATTSGDARLK